MNECLREVLSDSSKPLTLCLIDRYFNDLQEKCVFTTVLIYVHLNEVKRKKKGFNCTIETNYLIGI